MAANTNVMANLTKNKNEKYVDKERYSCFKCELLKILDLFF